MDEGHAALYAAIIGFAAAIIGAAVGGWASWRAARHSADAAAQAAAQQIAGQGRNEHLQWIRQERRTAYGEVIKAYCTYSETTAILAALLSMGLAEEAKSRAEEASRDLHDLNLAIHGVLLWGSKEVERATVALYGQASELRGSLKELHTAVRERPSDRARREEVALSDTVQMGNCYRDFTLRAAEALRGATE
ncbi:hypothetical protein [Streptomyces lydicamycinicus]|uniref:hypothetical protein n=1 Tax=Streptomyces lydicamycinicus TaxID=1546107 RepID=UPI003C2E99BA